MHAHLLRAESNAFNAELNAYFRKEQQADARDEAVNDALKYRMNEALTDEAIFETLDQGYEVVSAYKSQVMSALLHLDDARKGKPEAMTAVLDALKQMKDNIERVLRDEAEAEYDGRME